MEKKPSPVKELRKNEGYKTINEMALAFGLSYNAIFKAERGNNVTLSEKFRVPLERLGYCYEDVAKDYRSWRESHRI